MKYSNEIVIQVPRQQMIEILDEPENMQYWQKGLQRYELLEGEPGEVGSRMKLVYQMGKRRIEMIETITRQDFPEFFSASYEAKGVWNLVENRFTEVSADSTRWVSDCTFRFSGMMRIMSWFMPSSMFKKQSCQYMQDFKDFAEQKYSQQA